MVAGSAAERLLDAARTAANGNPFLAAEYLRSISQAGALPSGDLPLTIDALLRGKLPNDVGHRLAVHACAVIGRECALGVLRDVTQLDAAALALSVQELTSRHLVERVKDGSLRFVHDKIREAAYADLNPAEKVRLHRRAAEVLRREAGEDVRVRANILAHHCLAAEDWPAALDYLEQAGGHALERFAYADVVMYLNQALAINKAQRLNVASGRLARWQRQVGDAMQGLGDMPGSKAPLLASLQLLGRPLPRSALGVISGILVALLRQVWQRFRGERHLPPEGGAPANIEAALALDRLQRALYFGGEYGSLLLANLCTLNLPKASMPHQALALAYTSAGATAGLIPLPKVSESYFGLAAEVMAKEYDLEADTFRLNARGIHLLGLGKWDEAYLSSRTSASAAAEARYSRRFEEAAGVHALVAIAHGDLSLAWTWNEKALASSIPRGDIQMLSWGWLNRLFMQLAKNELEAGRATAVSLDSVLEKVSRPERIAALCLQGALRWQLGEREAGLKLIDRALELAKQERSISPIFEPYSLVASVLLEALSLDQQSLARRRQLDATCRILQRVARTFPIGAPRLALHEGERLRLQGKAPRAEAIWREGLARARKLGMTREIALLEAKLAAVDTEAHRHALSVQPPE
jgi:hypothetical protein